MEGQVRLAERITYGIPTPWEKLLAAKREAEKAAP